MRQLLCIAAFFIVIVHSIDYFDQLQDEFKQTPTGQVRRFFITAEESIWDYSSQSPTEENSESHIIGTRYYKALYQEYEDQTYTKKKQRHAWQGNMGPILRAEVGDIIQVFFWNRASRNYTMHPHGIFYEFEMEGAVFEGAYEDSSVMPNHNYTYTWNVLPRAGPGPNDGSSIVWGYHSHVTENDIYAGLYGAIVIYKPGTLNDKDIVSSFFIADENLSSYLSKTMSTLYPDFDKTKYDRGTLYAARTFPSINGLASAAPKDLIFEAGAPKGISVVTTTKVTWHLLGWGTYWDVQYIQWQDAKVILNGQEVDHVRLMPASFYTVEVFPKNRGVYKFGFLDESVAKKGMTMNYSVV